MNIKIFIQLTGWSMLSICISQQCTAMENEIEKSSSNKISTSNKVHNQFLEYLIDSGLIEKSGTEIKKRMNETFNNQNEQRAVSALIYNYFHTKRIDKESLIQLQLEQQNRNSIFFSTCPEIMRALTDEISSTKKYLEKIKQTESEFEIEVNNTK